MKKIIITIISIVIVVVSYNSILSYNNYETDKEMIQEKIPSFTIVHMSDYRYKNDMFTREYIFSNAIYSELCEYRENLAEDYKCGFPNEYIGQRCRVVTFKYNEKYNTGLDSLLVFFKNGKIDYIQLRYWEVDGLILKKFYANNQQTK